MHFEILKWSSCIRLYRKTLWIMSMIML